MSIFHLRQLRQRRQLFILGCLSCLCCFLFSCSEEDSTTDEFANWQERNAAMTEQWAANSMLRKIRVYTQDDSTPGKNSDYIYVQVLESGDDAESPLYTDTARVAYRGRLIPTTNYTNGYVFDETYIGDFSWHTAGMSTMSIGGGSTGVVSGFATALMNMHKGDRWLVYIPYQLGYNSSSQGSVTAYSNLIFDIALLDYWHQGDPHPAFRARMK